MSKGRSGHVSGCGASLRAKGTPQEVLDWKGEARDGKAGRQAVRSQARTAQMRFSKKGMGNEFKSWEVVLGTRPGNFLRYGCSKAFG